MLKCNLMAIEKHPEHRIFFTQNNIVYETLLNGQTNKILILEHFTYPDRFPLSENMVAYLNKAILFYENRIKKEAPIPINQQLQIGLFD